MRTLSEITTTIIPVAPGTPSFGRRPISASAPQTTCMVLFRHDQTGAMVSVSDDDDAVGAVWIPKAMLNIDPYDRGRFLVVTISQALIQQHHLDDCATLNWDRYLPEERLMLQAACDVARRKRDRLSGRASGRRYSRCNGRDHYA